MPGAWMGAQGRVAGTAVCAGGRRVRASAAQQWAAWPSLPSTGATARGRAAWDGQRQHARQSVTTKHVGGAKDGARWRCAG
ncbi:hypothetical protein ACP4OV_007390 [Aristida adscensionis]